MKYLISLIQRRSSGKNVILFFILAMVVYATMLFYTIPSVEKYSQGMKLFDLSPTGYSYEYANELLLKLGEGGRKLYLYYQIPLDFLYPGLFAISCCLLLSWVLLNSKSLDSKWYYCCLIPPVAGCFDYIENISIIGLIICYPDISKGQVTVSSFATIAKSASTSLFFVLLIFVGIAHFVNMGKTRE